MDILVGIISANVSNVWASSKIVFVEHYFFIQHGIWAIVLLVGLYLCMAHAFFLLNWTF